MNKLIIKSNEWYESLPELKGSLFFLALVLVPYVLLMIFLNKPYYNFSIVWPVLVGLWRFSYKVIQKK